MAFNLIPLIFAVFIALTYYYTNRINARRKYGQKILSFAAGVSITYVLLELFPAFTEVALSVSKFMFLSILLGFIIHHLIEKEIYKHNREHQLVKLLSLEEDVFSFLYHIILGIVLVTFSRGSAVQAVLVFIPILTFTLVSTLPMRPHPSREKTIIMSSSTIIGVLLASFVKMAEWFEFSLIGFATGVLLYTVIRHHIPFGSRGRVGYFTVGFVLYSLFIIMTWYV